MGNIKGEVRVKSMINEWDKKKQSHDEERKDERYTEHGMTRVWGPEMEIEIET